MKIKSLMFLPAVKDLRTWWLDLKREKERKRILRIRQMKVRTQPFSREENEKEMKKFIMSGTYKDSDGKQRKIEKLGRSMESYFREF